MVADQNSTLSNNSLPPGVLEEMDRLNQEAAPLHIWLRTRANAPQKHPWHHGMEEQTLTL